MFSSIFVAALLASSVSALYTPRSRHLHARHAINARVAIPDPLPAPVAEPLAEASARQLKVKRDSKKCKPRSSTATPLAPAAAPSTPAAAPVNVAPDPPKVVSAKPPPPSPTHNKPPPSPTSKPAANERKTTSAPAPQNTPHGATSSGSNSANIPFSGDFHPDGISGGDGTFYATGLGACGWTNYDNQDIVAVPFGLWDAVPGYTGGNPNNNPICGKFIDVSYQGKTVTVEIVDECMGCTNIGSADLSPHAFNQLADPSVGRISGITWKWH